MTIQVWIKKEYISENDLSMYPVNEDKCIQITIDRICKLCNKKRTPFKGCLGSKDEETSFWAVCAHSGTYGQIYEHRVKPTINTTNGIYITHTVIKNRAKIINSANDGMKCAGSCGSWVPMAEANQSDGSFICYGCRSSF